MGLELNMNKIKTFVDIKKGNIPSLKPTHTLHNSRRPKCPSILIREIEFEDNPKICKLLFEHFRSLTIPAIIYWLVQHVYDLVAIVVINFCLLSIYNLFYFCLLFLVYLFVRARYEIEKHIKQSCPDLVDTFKTYRTHKGSNFWVAYVSGDQSLQSSLSESDKGSNSSPKNSMEKSNSAESKSKFASTESDKLNGQKLGNEVNELNFSQSCQAFEILGCVGITPYRNKANVGQMVRLVVTRKRRNMKVGTRLLEHLETKALELGYNEIRVFTNNLNTAYLQFLKQHGFQIIQIVRRGLMRGDLIVWNKVLKETEATKEFEDSNAFGNALFIPE